MIEEFKTISAAEIKANGVQALADRPNRPAQYGVGGMTGAQLKVWFDRLSELLAGRINGIINTLGSDDAPRHIRVPLDSVNIRTLADLIDGLSSGDVAADLLKVTRSIADTEKITLQARLNADDAEKGALAESWADGTFAENVLKVLWNGSPISLGAMLRAMVAATSSLEDDSVQGMDLGYDAERGVLEVVLCNKDGTVLNTLEAEILPLGAVTTAKIADGAVTMAKLGSDVAARMSGAEARISAAEGKIPAQASNANQLADKAFVNSSIATATATFRGTVSSVADLPLGADINDYAFVTSTDAAGNTIYARYKYNGSGWVYEYELNSTGFTAEQWAAISSGATAERIGKIGEIDERVTDLEGGEAALEGRVTALENAEPQIDTSNIANAIKGKVEGQTLSLADISPLQQTLTGTVTGASNLSSVKVLKKDGSGNLVAQYTVSADGTFNAGEPIFPTTILTTDTAGAVVDVEYNRDINKVLPTVRKTDTIEDVAYIVRNGWAKEVFKIGDQIVIPWKDVASGVTYEVPHDIVSFQNAVLEDGSVVPAMYLQWHYCTPFGIPFDAPEPDNADANIAQHGYNRWSQSAVRQFLNSGGGVGAWWSAQSETDVAPDEATTKAGFLSGYGADFLSCIKSIKVKTSTNTATDGGVTDVTYDKFFLPSLEQMYAKAQAAGIEGEAFEYWRQAVGKTEPNGWYTDNANPAYITYAINAKTSAQNVRLRSASRGHSYVTWYFYTSGGLSNSYARDALRFAPVCAIC